MAESGRFSIIPARAFDDTRLGSGPLRLLGLIGTYSNKQGWCWPAVTTLADRLGQTRRGIQKHLVILRELGYIQVRTNSGNANHYKILHDTELSTEFDRTAKETREPGVRRGVRTLETGCEPGVRPNVPKNMRKKDSPLLSPKGERKKRRHLWPDGLILTQELSDYAQSKAPGCDPPAMWDQFENHHRAKGSMFVDWNRAWFTWVNSPYEKPMNGGSHERTGALRQPGTHPRGKHQGPASFVEASREVLALRSRQS